MPDKHLLLGVLPAIIPFRFPNAPKVRVYFTTALYGNISLDSGMAGEAEQERRASLAQLLGFATWTELRQVHGDKLLIEPEPTFFNASSNLEADGAATTQSGRALLSKAADCQQIMLADKTGEHIAALHCGWRGNLINFPGKAIQIFCKNYGLKPSDVMAVRGPSLGPGAAEFINFDTEWGDSFAPWFDYEKKLMNLWSLTKHQLTEAGVRPENIFSIDLCTFTLSDFLFSHRRGHTGRQAAVIFIEN